MHAAPDVNLHTWLLCLPLTRCRICANCAGAVRHEQLARSSLRSQCLEGDKACGAQVKDGMCRRCTGGGCYAPRAR